MDLLWVKALWQPCILYSASLNVNLKVFDFVQSSGPKWMVGGMVFEMWLGSL